MIKISCEFHVATERKNKHMKIMKNHSTFTRIRPDFS